MALFESYERREPQILAVLKEYGISSIEECKEITEAAGLEDLGKGTRSMVGTTYGTVAKGPRYLELTDGYITKVALDENDEIIGYQYVNFGKMMDFIKGGMSADDALKKASGQYGRVADAARLIDPRHE